MEYSRNSVVAHVSFDFKGNHFNPSVVVNLDHFFQTHLEPESIYITLAQSGGIGLYSYELEVMMCEEIFFSEPTGVAVDYLKDGRLDWMGLEKAWRALSVTNEVGVIANTHFNVENLDEHPRLAAALMDAYLLGSEVVSKNNVSNNGLNEGFYG